MNQRLPRRRNDSPVVMPDTPYPTTPDADRASRWGRTEWIPINNGNTIELARVELEMSEALLVSIDVLQAVSETFQAIFDAGSNTSTAYVWATITVGNGATDFTRNIRIDDRVDFTVCASYVSVVLFMADKNGNIKNLAPWSTPAPPFNPNNSAQVAVNVARDTRGTPFVPNQSLTVLTVASTPALMSATPLEVLSVHAHLTAGSGTEAGPTNIFLQAYDVGAAGDVVGGRIPEHEFILTGGLILYEFELVLVSPIGFGRGLVWALSTTSGSYVASTATAWIQCQRWAL